MWRSRTTGSVHAGMNRYVGVPDPRRQPKRGVKKELSALSLAPRRMPASEVEEETEPGQEQPQNRTCRRLQRRGWKGIREHHGRDGGLQC